MTYLHNNRIFKQRRRDLRKNQTDAESAFWAQVRNRRFCNLRFVRQYSIGPYILDFFCPSLKIAVELDGGQHNEPQAKDYDEARTEYLNAHGIKVLRFWNNDVLGNMEGVLEKVKEIIND